VTTRLVLPALGLALIASIFAGLALHVHQGANAGTEHHVDAFVAVLAAGALAYFAACRTIMARPTPPSTLWLVGGVALAMRGLVLTAPPFLSSDLYRYVWDGRVQAAGINPYRYLPADPALASLRDTAIYPHVNRREYAPTIYPPTAQLVFRAVAAISQTPLAIRLACIAFEALAFVCLAALLTRAGLPSSRVLIYAWNPLAVWSYAGNGHVDALAIGLIPLALLLHAARREALTGAALAAAILVKFFPVAIAPALWRFPRARMPLACLATIAALYALYASAGARLTGFLGAYGHEEGIAGGSGIWALAGLAHLIRLPPLAAPTYLLAAATTLAVLAARVLAANARRTSTIPETARNAGLLAGATIFAISPHYPWYFPFLALFATLSNSRALIWLSAAPLLLTLDPFHEFFVWPSLIYVPALALAAADIRATKRIT
jgi:hypothetical protein